MEELSELRDNLFISMRNVEISLNNQIENSLEKAKFYKRTDKFIDDFYLKNSKKLIRLNIGGKIFNVYVSVLLKMKDTLFYVLFISYLDNNEEIPEEIFIDRNYQYFDIILNILKFENINFKGLTLIEKEELVEELIFYGLAQTSICKDPKMKRMRELIPESFWTDSDKIVLRGFHGNYLQCKKNGQINTKKIKKGQNNIWTPEIDEDDYISLKNDFGAYMNKNNQILNCVLTKNLENNQKFKFIRTEFTASGLDFGMGIENLCDSQFVVITTKSNEFLLSNQPNGTIECNRTDPGPWEKFSGVESN